MGQLVDDKGAHNVEGCGGCEQSLGDSEPGVHIVLSVEETPKHTPPGYQLAG